METSELRERNSVFWVGGLLLILTVVTFSIFFFVALPGQGVLPYVNILFSVLAVIAFAIGLRRAIAEPQRYRGKTSGWVFTVFSFLLLLFVIFGFYVSRHLPSADAAPQIGQRAPDFELKDMNGQTVSLAGLLAQPTNTSDPNARPKAVLLVFYRGYW